MPDLVREEELLEGQEVQLLGVGPHLRAAAAAPERVEQSERLSP